MQMGQTAAVAGAAALTLICLFWVYGYFRRRMKNRP
jgi:hypothetical protein